MKLIKLNCSACGAPISIPDNLEQLTCSNCGTFLMVEHGEGYYALKAVEQLSEAIQQSSKGTQDAIREGAQVTQIELKRLQLSQSLSSANSALNATQSEQRILTRSQMTPAAVKQLQELKLQEYAQREEIRRIQKQIDLLEDPSIEVNPKALINQINLLDRSMVALKGCPQSSKNQLILQNLIKEKQKYQGYLNALKANQIRETTPSFAIKPPFSTDLAELANQLRQVQADLNSISRQPAGPVKSLLYQELTNLNHTLYRHYHQEVYRQSWGKSNPDADPGQDYQALGQHLNATRSTVRWLSAVPAPDQSVGKEIKKLQKSEKKVAKSFFKAQEQHQFSEAKQALIAGLAAFAIAAPFSNDLHKVREQASIYQQDLKSLQSRPASPEVKQVQGELNQRYQALYQHWSTLEKQALEAELKSNAIRPPFSDDFSQARTDYDLIMADIEMLKKKKDIPGAQGLMQQLTAKQHLLYTHLQRLVTTANSENHPPIE
ncbi:MAG: zinc ribbon domain-containing protein [Anaerolineaceae bacterium]|nr:zinc ribbon domain-containing protein [Anaerolineaceae bacterium]